MNMNEQLIVGYTLYDTCKPISNRTNLISFIPFHCIMMMTLILCAFRYQQYKCKFLHHLYINSCVFVLKTWLAAS